MHLPGFTATQNEPLCVGMLTKGGECAVDSVCFNNTVACWHSAPLQVDGKHSDEAALILHRKGFDCRFSIRDTGLLCSTTQGKVSSRFLFVKLVCF